jgi:hypothetical protein
MITSLSANKLHQEAMLLPRLMMFRLHAYDPAADALMYIIHTLMMQCCTCLSHHRST